MEMTRPKNITEREIELLATGIAHGGAQVLAARDGTWNTLVEFTEETLQELATDWIRDGRLSNRVVTGTARDSDAIAMRVSVDEPLLVLGFNVPDWALSANGAEVVTAPQAFGLAPLLRAIDQCRNRLRVKLGYAIAQALRETEPAIANTDWEWGIEWPTFGSERADEWDPLCEVFHKVGRPLTNFERSYVTPVQETGVKLGLPRSRAGR